MTSFVVDQLFGGTLLAALPIAVFAGLISFLSPCVLPLVPGYVAYATGFASTKGKVLLGSLLFVLGFTFIFLLASKRAIVSGALREPGDMTTSVMPA